MFMDQDLLLFVEHFFKIVDIKIFGDIENAVLEVVKHIVVLILLFQILIRGVLDTDRLPIISEVVRLGLRIRGISVTMTMTMLAVLRALHILGLVLGRMAFRALDILISLWLLLELDYSGLTLFIFLGYPDANIYIVIDHEFELYFLAFISPFVPIIFKDVNKSFHRLFVHIFGCGDLILVFLNGLINIDVFDVHEPKYRDLKDANDRGLRLLENVVLAVRRSSHRLPILKHVVHEVDSIFEDASMGVHVVFVLPFILLHADDRVVGSFIAYIFQIIGDFGLDVGVKVVCVHLYPV